MILDKINSPKDLKSLTLDELKQLAKEIRSVLIETTSKTGGHLASNLGVVELTIALHYALDSPKDKIIWDVGHQCYTHKLLTGRRERFSTLRTIDGISGFPKRSESPHDIADTGHASTSCSLAAGLAEAAKLANRDNTVVAVIGDGAFTGGLAYEALNNAGHMKTPLIVILNDNEMSISPNVGAVSSYLSRIRVDPTLAHLKDEIESRIQKLPGIGDAVSSIGQNIKELIKGFILPGRLFEDLGFAYVGPLDGHNIAEVARDISLAKQLKSPVLIHVITKKGLGYPPAEKHREKFHGTEPFDIKTGEPKKTSNIPTYTKVFGDTILDLAKKDDRIVAITAAMTPGTGLQKFRNALPERFYDVGIAEEFAVSFAAGLALSSFKPVVCIYSTFLQRAYDQIVHDVCLENLPVVFAIDRGGLVGEDGPTHHGCFDISYLRHIPNMTVMAPKDEAELRDMIFTALTYNSPVAIRYPRSIGAGVPLDDEYRTLPLGRSEILREGRDVCFLAFGRMVEHALAVSDILWQDKVSSSIINLRFAKPLDSEAVISAAISHPLLVTLEENALQGGVGSAISELLIDNDTRTKTLRFGIPDRFLEHGETSLLLNSIGLSPKKIASRIKRNLPIRLAELGK